MWFSKKKRIYLDYASATPVLENALDEVIRVSSSFGNPGSVHAEGVAAKTELEQAREKIASELACKAREIIFVSGGSEANNLAIVGFAQKLERIRRGLTGTHWLVSAIEHPSVLECFSEVERLGGVVEHLPVNEHGFISLETLEKALRPETVFVSIGWANHEIGVVQDLSHLARTIRAHEQKHSSTVLFHSDASQAPLYRAPHVHTLGVDILTLDSGKLYGPRGIGALYISNRVELTALMHGGKQERGLRAGTENVALAAGFALALSTVSRERDVESHRLQHIRENALREIEKSVSDIQINGSSDHSLPHILNLSIKDVDVEYITLALDKKGFAVATKSACREGEERRSHVVEALYKNKADEWRSEHTIRISFGRTTTNSDVSSILAELENSILLFRKEKMI